MSFIFSAWHVTRAGRNSHGRFPDIGYDVVNRGLIELTADEIRIYDKDDIDTHLAFDQSPVRLRIHLALIYSLHLTRFRSERGSHRGGQIRIVGRCDRGYDETVTIQLPLEDYTRMATMLRERLA